MQSQTVLILQNINNKIPAITINVLWVNSENHKKKPKRAKTPKIIKPFESSNLSKSSKLPKC